MPLSENSTVVKIYLRKVTLEALKKIAEDQGISLSALMVQAAVEQYLNGRSNEGTRLATLERRVRALELLKLELPRRELEKQDHRSLSKLESPKHQKVDEFPQTFRQSSEPVIASSHEQIQLDRLVVRLGGSSGLKARLCQLGGRDGLLFQGDLGKALKVEEVTQRLDPEGKSWLPLAPNRLMWIQITAKEFCRRINSEE